jgi:nitrogen fixation NifU-like protein
MYQQIILDHAKRPVGKGLLGDDPGDAAQAHQVNPTCGDEVTLRLLVVDDVISSVTWDGQGCSISQASTSIMTGLVVGKPVAQALALADLFSQLMASRGKGLDSEEDEDALEDATAFTGTSLYPARIKCALLGWAALRDAIAKVARPKAEGASQ